ncbi:MULTISPECIES: IclR family transcriptional regulator [Brevibacillus]|jgi:DNA-binding IclR family transcriptional regulator|uniref:Glycerol operon regulatory protein n=1 Tax=Brevibacillus aydinogluensis TaxID=927786 RepID=A0AA48M5I9_9BACL|nr:MULTISPECIES: IclR family transcriptional regulator [Bacillales]REK61249.1 MAG: IclR family transcriptional regulator [Brevibacillus sp.]MBR8661641.1 IclR family transcriptional regulator [Brevibacillus sp. NL20B1]MDT3416973.1 DNA-binding IclR family transcriptional regulator [Brevibacillus aydinogluensis]UFJ61454.1 IclR family transcriptional regulator [Anoxybacillus sediminis]CAJ1001685.1 IclR family transcriptional regulator [Brevibacillus aydinogluensis]
MEEAKTNVRAVERALDILLCFTDSTDLGLSEIASRLSLHKSTVHRLLATLENKGFLIRDAQTEKYRLGFRIWELSANLTHSDDPATVLLPEMERLRDLVGETISLYVRDGNERIRIQAVQSNQPIRRVAPIGARMPLFVGASSKVLVAYAEPEVLQAVLNDPNWPDSIDREAYLEQLEQIRAQGFATSVEERELGAAAVAAPIFNRNGKLVAAIAASGPSNRLTPEKMREFARPIMEAAYRMGKMMK